MSHDIVPSDAVGISTRTHAARTTIFAQGDKAEQIFYIRKGRIKLTVTSDQGKEAIVAIPGPGSFFGECAFNGRNFYYATASTLERSAITSIAAKSMSELLKADPDVARHFTAYLLERTFRLEDDLKDQLFSSAEKRLARLLVKLADHGRQGEPTPVPVSLTHSELADMVGTTRSRVTNFMGKFKKRGYISYDGHIKVHHSMLDAVLGE